MNREFQATPSYARIVFAAAAAAVTLSLAGFIDGLASYYSSNGAQIANQTVVSARV